MDSVKLCFKRKKNVEKQAMAADEWGLSSLIPSSLPSTLYIYDTQRGQREKNIVNFPLNKTMLSYAVGNNSNPNSCIYGLNKIVKKSSKHFLKR